MWLQRSAALWFWHIPGPYRWAQGNEAVHSAEHQIFFLTSLAGWSLLLAPYGRRQLGQAARSGALGPARRLRTITTVLSVILLLSGCQAQDTPAR